MLVVVVAVAVVECARSSEAPPSATAKAAVVAGVADWPFVRAVHAAGACAGGSDHGWWRRW